MSWEQNPYYDATKLGLEILGELDEPGLSYEFNKLIVVHHKESGRIFWAQDSGCSCPTPFEGFNFDGPDATNMQEVQEHNWKAFEDEVNSFCPYEHTCHSSVPQGEKDDLLSTVKYALKSAVTK